VETRPYRSLSELHAAPPRLSLLDKDGREGIYVPLRFDLRPSRASLEGRRLDQALLEEAERDLSRTDVNLAEVLAEKGHLIFIGAAGSGKTTILRLIAAVLATQNPTLAHDYLALLPTPYSLLPTPCSHLHRPARL